MCVTYDALDVVHVSQAVNGAHLIRDSRVPVAHVTMLLDEGHQTAAFLGTAQGLAQHPSAASHDHQVCHRGPPARRREDWSVAATDARRGARAVDDGTTRSAVTARTIVPTA